MGMAIRGMDSIVAKAVLGCAGGRFGLVPAENPHPSTPLRAGFLAKERARNGAPGGGAGTLVLMETGDPREIPPFA